jgi:hypothetical protein
MALKRAQRFPTALATVQRTEQPFHYQLVIARAYQEGEAELLDDIDDDDGMSLIVRLPSKSRCGELVY